jgi:DNA-binding transcriptional LysR family regulator
VLQEAPPGVLLTSLRQGELDFVVGRIPIDNPEIAFERIYEQPICVVAGHAHPLVRRRRVTWAMAAQERWIFPHEGTARTALEATLIRAGQRVPHPHIETISLTAIETLVEQGLLALMPRDVARRQEALGRLKVLPLKIDVALPGVSLAWEASRQFTPPMTRFADALRAAAAQLMAESRGGAARREPKHLAPYPSTRAPKRGRGSG